MKEACAMKRRGRVSIAITATPRPPIAVLSGMGTATAPHAALRVSGSIDMPSADAEYSWCTVSAIASRAGALLESMRRGADMC